MTSSKRLSVILVLNKRSHRYPECRERIHLQRGNQISLRKLYRTKISIAHHLYRSNTISIAHKKKTFEHKLSLVIIKLLPHNQFDVVQALVEQVMAFEGVLEGKTLLLRLCHTHVELVMHAVELPLSEIFHSFYALWTLLFTRTYQWSFFIYVIITIV
jgi:hypothetical protein